MKICGIELKSNNVIVSVIEYINEEIHFIDTKIKKIVLDNDEDSQSISKFQKNIDSFLKEHYIEKIALKKRAKKGTFAGGAVTFKSEAIIQLNSICKVNFVSPQAISKYTKTNEIVFPKELNKYQEQAYLTAMCID